MKVSIALITLLAGLATATPLVEIIVTDDITVIEDMQATCAPVHRDCDYPSKCCPGLKCRYVCFFPMKPTWLLIVDWHMLINIPFSRL